MKIIALQAENIKRLVAVEIRPNGNLVEITGKNGQGKTSVLDAIWWALEGATHIQAAPIRKGASEAVIRLDLGDLKVMRRFKAKEEGGFTTSITVENQEGARFPSPQKVLDDLIGALSFDPLAFTRMKAPDQFETLKRFVPGVDFAAIDKANDADFAKRTDVNRRAKELRAQASGISAPLNAVAEIDVSALIDKLNAAGEHNTLIEQRKAGRAAAAASVQAKKDQAAQLRQEAARLMESAAAIDTEIAVLQKKIDEAPALADPVDTAALRQEITAAQASNAQAAQIKLRTEYVAKADAYERESAALTKAMGEREEAKRAAISAAKMPIDGIGFGDGEVLLDGLPFDQASDAQQLRASIAIAAAMNPKLRVIRVRDGSLLDEDAMKLLAKFADEKDMQVWVETVGSSQRRAFVIEDGHLKLAEEDAVAA